MIYPGNQKKGGVQANASPRLIDHPEAKRCKLDELAVPRPLLPSYEVDHHRSDVINLWPGNSCSPFRSKNKKSDVLPLMALLGFLEGTFSGPKILQTDPGEVTPHDLPGQPEKM